MIKLENFKYIKDKEFVTGNNFEVAKGKICQIQGSNGEGKSLFLKALAMLHPLSYQKYYIDDKVITNRNDILEKIIYVPQFIRLSQKNFLEFKKFILILNQNQLQKEAICSIFDIYFEKFKIKQEWININFENLSGGQRQTLSLIMALSLNKKYLLLDESFSMVDHTLKKLFLDELYELSENNKTTIIYISHEEKLLNCDDIYRIKNFNIEKINE